MIEKHLKKVHVRKIHNDDIIFEGYLHRNVLLLNVITAEADAFVTGNKFLHVESKMSAIRELSHDLTSYINSLLL